MKIKHLFTDLLDTFIANVPPRTEEGFNLAPGYEAVRPIVKEIVRELTE